MTTPPRHLLAPLIDYLRSLPNAPALLITADGARAGRIATRCPHCGLPVGPAGPHLACEASAEKRRGADALAPE